ncbi:hypothetical protein BDK51DRAFT_30853, partial [Blyttiomyces helicus]
FDNMGHGKQRKLTAMALANLLSTNDLQILERLQSIFIILSSVESEITNCDEPITYTYESQLEESTDETSAHAARRRALFNADPLNASANLVPFMRARLHECAAANGGGEEFARHVLARIDPTIVEQMRGLLA